MFEYKDGALHIFKYKELGLKINILEDQLKSYREYKDKVIQEDVDYLCYLINSTIYNGTQDIRAKVKVLERIPKEINREMLYRKSIYYPVVLDFYVNGVKVRENVPLMHLPYMDEYCILNVNGKKKTIINKMTRSEDISFDDKNKTVVVNLPDSFFKIITKSKNTFMGFNIRRTDVPIHSIVYAFAKHYGLNDLDINKLYTNSIVTSALFESKRVTNLSQETDINTRKIINTLIPDYNATENILKTGSKGKLGLLRNNLNKRLSIDACLGQVLSRDIGTPSVCLDKGIVLTDTDIQRLKANKIENVTVQLYGDKCVSIPTDHAKGYTIGEDIHVGDGNTECFYKGTYVSQEILRKLKLSKVNEVYIRAIPNIIGRTTFEGIGISRIPKGVSVTALIKKIIPELKDSPELKTKKEFILEKPFTIKKGTKLQKEHIKLLFECGFETINCKTAADKYQPIVYRFEQEIIGNYTLKARDLVEDPMDLPKGIKGDDWIFYKGLKDINDLSGPNCPTTLTLYDILGLISLSGRLIGGDPYNEAFNADADFLKKIDMSCQIFSQSFREASEKFLRLWHKQVKRLLDIDFKINKDSVFQDFEKFWIAAMWEKTLLRDSKDQTPISIITQANKVLTPTASKRSVSIGQRMLAMGFYGKICPYDVPQGQNIGLVNTLAAGCKIIDGIPYAPYIPIVEMSGKHYVSDNVADVVWFNAEMEREYIIADIESLHYDKEGAIQDELVLARIPDSTDNAEKVKLGLVHTTKVNYVNALGEETLSPGAQVIPNANSDDPVRINFGISLFLNSIYTQGGEAPYVYTEMYKHMYTYSNEFLVKAEYDGYIVDIQPNRLIVKYDHQQSNTVYELIETKLFNTCIITMNYKKKIGEHFKRNDVLVDTPVSKNGFYSPGSNVLLGYLCWGGFNYEDAKVLGNHTSFKFVSIASHKVKKSVSKDYIETPKSLNMFKYIPKHGVIDILTEDHKSKADLSDEKEWRTHEESGILYSIERDNTAEGKENEKPLVAKFLSFNKLKTGDKMSGRHGNKGAVSRLEADSNMPCFYNGVPLAGMDNPLGIGSRMNPGQIDEAPLGFAGFLLNIPVCCNSFNGASVEDVACLNEFVYDISNAEIKDDYIYSLYRTNSRVLIEVCRVASEIYADLDVCNITFNEVKDILKLSDNQDLEKVRADIRKWLGSSETMTADVETMKSVRRFLFDIDIAITDISTSYENLLEGFERLIEKVGKSSEVSHKKLVSDWNAIGATSNYSETYKQLQRILLIRNFIKDIANDSLDFIDNKYFMLPSEVREVARERFWVIKEWENCFFPDGTALLYNPETGVPFEGHVGIGVSYFLKIVQEVDEKTGAREGMLSESYTRLENQAPQGANRGGGQRTGEMELAALLAFGASNIVYEIYNTCSDNVGERVKEFCSALNIDSSFVNKEQCHPRTVDLLRYILEGANVGMNISNYPGIDKKTIDRFQKFRGPLLFKEHLKSLELSEEEEEKKLRKAEADRKIDEQFKIDALGDID